MTKIISARIDEQVADELDRAARQLGMTKRQFLEEAIRLRAATARSERERIDEILDSSFGAWERDESAGEIIERIRSDFEEAMLRNQPIRYDERR